MGGGDRGTLAKSVFKVTISEALTRMVNLPPPVSDGEISPSPQISFKHDSDLFEHGFVAS